MRGKLIKLAAGSLAAFLIIGCSSNNGSTEEKTNKTKEISGFNYRLTSAYSGQEISNRNIEKRELKIYTGELLAKNATSGETTTHPWSAYVDEENFKVTSNKTIVLKPGSYEFKILLTNGTSQYISETVYEVEDGKQINIPFDLKPVIGDVIANVNVIDVLPTFKFKYDVGELADYSSPKIGIKIDDGNKVFFNINPSTGLSDTYVNISNGSHDISLEFFNGTSYIGRSAQFPASVNVIDGEDINLDLVALHGEATVGFNETNSTLDLTVNIPSQIVTEVQDLNNLKTIIKYAGTSGSGEKEITNEHQSGSDYSSSTTLEDIKYGSLAFSLEFMDSSDSDELIGSCNVEEFMLNDSNQTVNCDVTIRKRSTITGNLLATVGLNVYNDKMEPIKGAKLYVDDKLIGLSGSGTFGTDGYLKQYMEKGARVLKATKDGKFGDEAVTLSTLSVNNVDLIVSKVIAQKSCKDILTSGNSTGSGTYSIDPDGDGGMEPFDVYCDMTTDGGGWTRFLTSPSPSQEYHVEERLAPTIGVPTSDRETPWNKEILISLKDMKTKMKINNNKLKWHFTQNKIGILYSGFKDNYRFSCLEGNCKSARGGQAGYVFAYNGGSGGWFNITDVGGCSTKAGIYSAYNSGCGSLAAGHGYAEMYFR
ncbi:MAG: fibrinogen-like YCDxxxxGGGW domain-containing protein [Campylobacterales bacterium]|nr:fibrinogen-like YCDxxxxGGGW domain-containing protein [Campylobacterales bacterium]